MLFKHTLNLVLHERDDKTSLINSQLLYLLEGLTLYFFFFLCYCLQLPGSKLVLRCSGDSERSDWLSNLKRMATIDTPMPGTLVKEGPESLLQREGSLKKKKNVWIFSFFFHFIWFSLILLYVREFKHTSKEIVFNQPIWNGLNTL